MQTILRTDELQPHARLDAWVDTIRQMFVSVESDLDDRRTFHGVLRTAAAGRVQISDIAAGAQVVTRTPALTARHEEDFYKLNIQLAGNAVIEQDGRQSRLSAGDMAMCDTSRPYLLAFDSDMRTLVLMFPRTLLPIGPDRVATLTAQRIPGSSGVPALVTSFLTTMTAQLQCCSPTTVAQLANSAIALVSTMLGERLDAADGEIREGPQSLWLRVQEYIDQRMDDPLLSVEEIAAAHHLSRRYLYKLFELQGTSVARWIRERRLDHCASDLADPALTNQGITSIAARWGLYDAAHFSRLFKAAYGETPRDYRKRMLVGEEQVRTSPRPWLPLTEA